MSINDTDGIIDTMLTYGGSFAQAWARCYQAADDDNRKRLRDGFPELIEQYREMARLRREVIR
jgi:hypothetical protein